MQAASCSLGEPLALSTFALPSASISKANHVSHVLGSYTSVPRNEEGWLTLTCQGDGVHIVDLSNNRRFASFTLGPATTFSCPSITTVVEDNGKLLRTTYAVIKTSPDIDPDERGRTVWIWQETYSGISPTMSTPKRAEAMVEQHINSMHYIRSSDSFVLFSEENEIVLVDSRFQLLHSIQLQNQDRYGSLQRWVFQHATFIASPNAVTIVQAIHRANERLHLLFHSCSLEGPLAFLGEVETDLEAEEVAQCTLSHTGDFSLLSRRGQWFHHRIRQTNESLSWTESTAPLHLKSLTFHGSTLTSSPISLLPLTASHVLLASVSSASSEVVLQIWDLKYSILMSVGTTPMSGLSSEFQLNLIDCSKSQAILIVSPPIVNPPELPAKARRSTLFSVPYSVPHVSTIAIAMLQSQRVNQNTWINSNIPVLPSTDSDKNLLSLTSPQIEFNAYGLSSWATSRRESDVLRSEYVENIQAALDGGAYADAAGVFFTWCDQEAKFPRDKLLEQDVTRLSGRRAARVPEKKTQTEQLNKPLVPHKFVATLIKIILQAPGIRTELRPVLLELFSSGCVFNNMLPSEGGILRRLMELEEWALALRALEVLPDISEEELARGLRVVVSIEAQPGESMLNGRSTNPTNPELDTLLQSYLGRLIVYPSSPALLRMAIRNHVNDPEYLTRTLAILSRWISSCVKRDDIIFVEVQPLLYQRFHVPPIEDTGDAMPPIDMLLLFIQIFLDTSFVILVRHEPAHKHLTDIASDVRLTNELFVGLNVLTGPLEPFARKQSGEVDGDHDDDHPTIGSYCVEQIFL